MHGLARLSGLALSLALVASACAPTAQPTTPPSASPPAESAPVGATPPPGYEGQTWADIVAEARGQTVNFYMWGGSEVINTWVTGYAANALQSEYGVTLNMVAVSDSSEFVNKVLGEQQAGRDQNGAVDLVWVNGENFRTLRQGNLLYGPFAGFLPNAQYVNASDPSVQNDFGYPVDGYESPYGQAQFVMIYDSARVPEPPTTMAALLTWIEAHPGRFTYAAPPDFTGGAFVRQVCYHAAGGYQSLIGAFQATVFDQVAPACWQILNELEPYLWRTGATYPENRTRLQDLFANGEVDFDMAYNPAEASSLIAQGRYQETTRTFVFDDGTLANTHFLAVPYNAAHKAAALVVANFMLSPAAQLSKADPAGWGDFSTLDPTRLPAEWQQRFASLARGPATLAPDRLAAARLPELQAQWVAAFEAGWEENVLKK